jgi:hypothetical protein
MTYLKIPRINFQFQKCWRDFVNISQPKNSQFLYISKVSFLKLSSGKWQLKEMFFSKCLCHKTIKCASFKLQSSLQINIQKNPVFLASLFIYLSMR